MSTDSGRGRRQFLTRKAVVAAGRRIVEADGVDGLTIRRVAADVGATPMALYRHVADKRQLLLAILEDVADGLPDPPGDGDPRERIFGMFLMLDTYLARHLWVVDVLRKGELFAPRAGALFPWALDRFGELGLDDRQAADAYATLWWFVLGHLSFLPATDPDLFASREELMKVSAARAGVDEERVLRAYRGLDHQAVFEHGLRALVASLAPS
jgi:AcrR family transcriptional regulator